MAWYNTNGRDSDVALSSRIRYARNIADYPFTQRLDNEAANEIIEKVYAPFKGDKAIRFIRFSDIAPVSAQAYVEKHHVSPEFARQTLPHALILDEAHNVSVMVCEEDHIRLQCITPGLSLGEAHQIAQAVDTMLGDRLSIAYEEKLGYLTHCPTNLGTGMRASVMMFLPALTMTGKIEQLASYLPKIGLTVRGTYGEGSSADGYLYQISNRITLGVTEEEILSRLTEAVNQIIAMERREREILRSDSSDTLKDRVCRSLGTLKHAYLLSSREFMRLYGDVRLGVSLNLIDDKSITIAKLDELMINIQPAMLTENTAADENSRDKARAAYVAKALEE